jgi:phage shock protein C
MNHRLYRSPDDRILAGVAGGMAETYDLDPALVRVGWALLILVSGGIFLVLYIIMAIVVPLRPARMPLRGATPATPPTPGSAAVPGASDGDPDAPPVPPGPTGSPEYAPWHYQRRHHRSDASGALVIGLILVGVGAFFLLRQYVPNIDTNLLWPLLAIAIGVLFIVAAFGRPGGAR